MPAPGPAPIVGFARRMTGYKRPLLLFEDLGRLTAIASQYPLLPDYDMRLAMALIAGSNVWLNTPLPPLEASGTSGMKAALNGVLNLSVLDGWWVEGCIEGVTGWAIGVARSKETENRSPQDAASLYRQLEHVVVPLYYRN